MEWYKHGNSCRYNSNYTIQKNRGHQWKLTTGYDFSVAVLPTLKAAQDEAVKFERAELSRRAALIGCKLVDDDTIETLNELVLDAFNAACRNADGTYDNMLMSTWIAAQEYLIRTGMIDADKCIRKQPAPSEKEKP